MGRKQILQRNYDEEGNLISKECSCCNKIKLVSEFYKDKTTIDGLQAKCKKCFKKYYQKNSDCIKEKNKKYKQENKGKIKEYQKEYNKKYYQENKDKIKEYQKEYQKEYNKEYKDKKAQEALQQIEIEVESDPDKYNYITNKEIYGVIYLVHNNKSDKYYVGQTTIGFDNRYSSGWLYYHKNKDTVKEDLELYGEESFKYTKIFKVAHSQYELDKLETYYIDYYDSYKNGYNENRGNIFTNRGKEK